MLLNKLTLIKQVHQKNDLYWYFLNYCFKFQPNICSRCLHLLMMSINLSDISILDIKDSDYGCIISLMSKKERINIDLTLKK